MGRQHHPAPLVAHPGLRQAQPEPLDARRPARPRRRPPPTSTAAPPADHLGLLEPLRRASAPGRSCCGRRTRHGRTRRRGSSSSAGRGGAAPAGPAHRPRPGRRRAPRRPRGSRRGCSCRCHLLKCCCQFVETSAYKMSTLACRRIACIHLPSAPCQNRADRSSLAPVAPVGGASGGVLAGTDPGWWSPGRRRDEPWRRRLLPWSPPVSHGEGRDDGGHRFTVELFGPALRIRHVTPPPGLLLGGDPPAGLERRGRALLAAASRRPRSRRQGARRRPRRRPARRRPARRRLRRPPALAALPGRSRGSSPAAGCSSTASRSTSRARTRATTRSRPTPR